MKKVIQTTFAKRGQKVRIFLGLILCLMLDLNLYGQKIQTILGETWVNNNWQNYTLITNTYDGTGFLTISLSQTWDVNSSSWKNASQTVFTNNPDGTVNQSVTQTWDGNTWNDGSRSTFTYNASKKVLTTISELWLGAFWMNSTKITNIYDGNGYLTNHLTQSWDFISSWINSTQVNYTNNPDGTVNESITQTWNGINAWNNTSRTTYTYNGSGYVLTTVHDVWTGADWQPAARETNTYDGSNKILTTETDTWTGSAWQAATLVTNTYDGSGYLTNELTQTWDTGSGSWKNSEQANGTNNLDGTPHQITFQSWDGVSAWNNTQRVTYTYVSQGGNEKSITLKVNLEGPLSGTTMTTALNTNFLIPQGQPYGNLPWLFEGSESVITVPSGVVDWVLVELRQADVPANATSATTISKRAAFLKSDGSIVDTDGTSPVQFADFTLTGGNSLFIVIRHRNHLAIMSSAGATPNAGGYAYDFTTSLGQAYGGGSGYKQVGSAFAMVAADIDNDGSIFVSDFNNWAVGFGGSNGYYNSDVDLDGSVFVSDFNNWAVNFGSTVDNTLKSAQIKPEQNKSKYSSMVPK